MSECKIGPSSASYIYTELWDHNETNQQVASYLQGARDKSANKPQIVAAYANNYDPASWAADLKDPSKQIHPQVTPEYGTCIEAESNQASVSGGAHIFSGDDSASGGAYANNYDPASWAAYPKDLSKQIHPQVTPEYGTCIEAESNQASVSGGAHIFSGDDSASGGAYAGDFYQGGDAVTFTIDAGQGGSSLGTRGLTR